MARNEFLVAAALTFLIVPAADALQCPKGQQTTEVYVTLAGCAKAPEEFVIKIDGQVKTVTRPDPRVARWHVAVRRPFCILDTTLTAVEVPGFRTACHVKGERAGPATAPVAVFNVPCAAIWGLVIEKEKTPESRFLYRVNRDPIVTCEAQLGPDQETLAPDSVGDLALHDDVTISVRMPKQPKPLVVTVKELVLRTKPNGARFGLLFRSSPARNESTDQVRDAFADRVDLIFKKEPVKKDDAK